MSAVIQIADARERRADRLQVENGNFTRISNQIIDDLMRYPFTANEHAVLWAVLRFTYGMQQKSARISRWKISEVTGIHPDSVSRTLRHLLSVNVLTREGQRGPIGIQKYSENWAIAARSESDASVRLKSRVLRQCQTESDASVEPIKKGKEIRPQEDKSSCVASGKPNAAPVAEIKKPKKPKRKALPACPYQEILDAWAKHLPRKPQPKILSQNLKNKIRPRWQDGFVHTHRDTGQVLYTDLATGIVWWNRFFPHIAKLPGLRGKHWFTFHWLMKPENFEKVLAGNYDEEFNR